MTKQNDEEIHYLITNLHFVGTEWTKNSKGGGIRDKFTLNLEGYEIIFKQLEGHDEIIKKLKKEDNNSGGFTTEIIVKTPLKNYDEVTRIVENLCWLLSFAKGTDVIPSQRFHFKNGKQVWFQGISIGSRPYKRDFVIPELPPEILVDFLNQTFPQFVKYREKLGLNILFNLYTSMKLAFYMEIRCAMGYILLETLSNKLQEYCEEIKKPVGKNSLWSRKRFKKEISPLLSEKNLSDRDIQQIIDGMSYPFPSLQDSIERIKRDFNFKYKEGEQKLFEYRKYFIHKGDFPSEVDKVNLYNSLIHFIDRILLSILGYEGEYCDVTNRYQLKDMGYEP